MVKLKKISLLQLSKAEMEKREQNMLRGGNDEIIDRLLPCVCVLVCACKYAGPQEGPDDLYYGGSSKEDSGDKNESQMQESFSKEYEEEYNSFYH